MADAAFLEWCQQHGVTTHSVQPGFVAEGWRGILAAHHIQAGAEVMSVPQQLLMSVMSARRDMQLSLLLQHHQLNSNQVCVCCDQLRQKHSRSAVCCARCSALLLTWNQPESMHMYDELTPVASTAT